MTDKEVELLVKPELRNEWRFHVEKYRNSPSSEDRAMVENCIKIMKSLAKGEPLYVEGITEPKIADLVQVASHYFNDPHRGEELRQEWNRQYVGEEAKKLKGTIIPIP